MKTADELRGGGAAATRRSVYEPVATYHGHRCARASVKSERGEAKVRNEAEPATRVKLRGEELAQVLPLAGVRTSVEKRAERNDEARRGEAIERSRGRAKRKPDEKKIARRTSLRARTHGEAGHSGRFERRDSPRISATIARTSSRLSSPSSYKILITTLAEWRARNDSERLGTTARRKADARRGLGGDGGSNRDNVVNS